MTDIGVIYTTGTKLAEHGGFSLNDRNVAMLVSKPGIASKYIATPVETRQIAPTVLKALGLKPSALKALAIEPTTSLPGLPF